MGPSQRLRCHRCHRALAALSIRRSGAPAARHSGSQKTEGRKCPRPPPQQLNTVARKKPRDKSVHGLAPSTVTQRLPKNRGTKVSMAEVSVAAPAAAEHSGSQKAQGQKCPWPPLQQSDKAAPKKPRDKSVHGRVPNSRTQWLPTSRGTKASVAEVSAAAPPRSLPTGSGSGRAAEGAGGGSAGTKPGCAAQGAAPAPLTLGRRGKLPGCPGNAAAPETRQAGTDRNDILFLSP